MVKSNAGGGGGYIYLYTIYHELFYAYPFRLHYLFSFRSNIILSFIYMGTLTQREKRIK